MSRLVTSMRQLGGLGGRLLTANPARAGIQRAQWLPAQIQTRTMYDECALGMDKLERFKTSKANMFGAGNERFVERIEQYLGAGNKDKIYLEDLINLIAVADSDRHLDLVENVAKMLQAETWGSLLMRVYYKLGKLERAHANLTDPSFGNFFSQVTSYKIVMTMLYNAAKHAEVLQIYEQVGERYGDILPLKLITMASCYHLNTQESFELAMGIQKALSKDDLYLVKRMRSMAALFALKRGMAREALDLVSASPGEWRQTREVKLRALMDLNRHEDVMYLLRSSLRTARSDGPIMTREMLEQLEAATDKLDEQSAPEWRALTEEVRSRAMFADVSLESQVLRPCTRNMEPRNRDPRRQPYGDRRDGFERRQDGFERRQDGFERRQDGRRPLRDAFEGRQFESGRRVIKSYFEPGSEAAERG